MPYLFFPEIDFYFGRTSSSALQLSYSEKIPRMLFSLLILTYPRAANNHFFTKEQNALSLARALSQTARSAI